MSDARTRELERRAQAGDVDAEVRLLLSQVRSGVLSEDRVRLSAFLGHGPARTALGLRAPSLSCADATDLIRYGREAVERGCIATVRLALPIWERAFPSDDRVPRGVSNAEAWVLAPGSLPDRGGVPLLSRAQHDAARQLPEGHESAAAMVAVAVDYTLAGVVSGGMGVEVVTAYTRNALVRGAQSDEVKQDIRDAIRADLLPWALGRDDPVRDRVEARKQGSAS